MYVRRVGYELLMYDFGLRDIFPIKAQRFNSKLHFDSCFVKINGIKNVNAGEIHMGYELRMRANSYE